MERVAGTIGIAEGEYQIDVPNRILHFNTGTAHTS